MFNNPMQQQIGTQMINRPVPKSTQPLTAEEINKLRSRTNAIDWQVTQEDVLKSRCTHKDKNGSSTLILNPDRETFHCTICGSDFSIFEGTSAEVQNVVRSVEDILQTIKTIYLDCPEKFVIDFFQFIPLLHKLPILWEEATKNFNRYDYNLSYGPIPTNGYTTNSWGLLQQLTNPIGMYPVGTGIGPQHQVPNMYPQAYPMGQMPAQPFVPNQFNQVGQVANPYPTMGQQAPSPFIMNNQQQMDAVQQQAQMQQMGQTQNPNVVKTQDNTEVVQTQAFTV